MRDLPLFLAVVAFCLPMGWSFPADAASFTGLGVGEDLFPGSGLTAAASVSADGTTVVGRGGGFGSTAFRWDAQSGLESLGDISGTGRSLSYGVSGDGSKIVGADLGSQNPPQVRGTLWTRETGLQQLDALASPGFDGQEFASGISADGSTIVGTTRVLSPSSPTVAFRIDAFGEVDILQAPADVRSAAGDVSRDGSVISGSIGNEAAVWIDDNAPLTIDFPGQQIDASFASGVSGDGRIVVGQARSRRLRVRKAFRWEVKTGVELLGLLPGDDFSVANAASHDGSTIVGSSGLLSGGRVSAFVWTAEHGLVELAVLLQALGVDLTGWTLTSAADISADGRTIVGTGRNPMNQREAFIAVIPEPSVSTLLCLGLAGLACRSGGRRRSDLISSPPRL